MCLRQTYERKEIAEVWWINGKDNPVNAFSKRIPNLMLERFITTKQLTIRIEAIVDRLKGTEEA
jgi:hypothetical protein